MGKFLIMAAIAGALLVASSVLVGDLWRSSGATEERAIRALISEWVEAYRNLNARRLVAHEAHAVEVVDRFGQLRLQSATENEKLWSDTFGAISIKSAPPTVTVDHIEFLRPEVALVQVSWQLSEGILLVDGDRIPPFSEIDTYVVTKTQDVWLVAAHNMQEKGAVGRFT
jgi:ketosteroid isomerase-like protein